ncbi:MAG: hypothetical protein ACQESD_07780 [Thermoplasmatota archaeon]
MGKDPKDNETAGLMGIIGGVLMLLAGVTGAATWGKLGDIAIEVTGLGSLAIVFQVLVLIGSLGGLVVILGGLMLYGKIKKGDQKTRVITAIILITIGAGFGIIGLIIFLVVTFMGEDPAINFLAGIGLGFIGLVMSIVARQKAAIE